MASGYRIVRLGAYDGNDDQYDYSYCGTPPQHRPGKYKARDEDASENVASPLSATPNPFTNQLDIQIPFANINENIELNLYDLQGRRVMALHAPGDQQTITLKTEQLLPGMYFLRAESGGVIQTVKVVKTQ